jgi:hypothetical protein
MSGSSIFGTLGGDVSGGALRTFPIGTNPETQTIMTSDMIAPIDGFARWGMFPPVNAVLDVGFAKLAPKAAVAFYIIIVLMVVFWWISVAMTIKDKRMNWSFPGVVDDGHWATWVPVWGMTEEESVAWEEEKKTAAALLAAGTQTFAGSMGPRGVVFSHHLGDSGVSNQNMTTNRKQLMSRKQAMMNSQGPPIFNQPSLYTIQNEDRMKKAVRAYANLKTKYPATTKTWNTFWSEWKSDNEYGPTRNVHGYDPSNYTNVTRALTPAEIAAKQLAAEHLAGNMAKLAEYDASDPYGTQNNTMRPNLGAAMSGGMSRRR